MDREGSGGPDWSDGENEVDEGIREDPEVEATRRRRVEWVDGWDKARVPSIYIATKIFG